MRTTATVQECCIWISRKRLILSTMPVSCLNFDIKGKELDWFMDYLFNRWQCVEYDGCKSDLYHVVNGVPQGSILGPPLFIVLMDDMPTMVKKCKSLMYADVLYCFVEIRIVQLFRICLPMKLTKLPHG